MDILIAGDPPKNQGLWAKSAGKYGVATGRPAEASCTACGSRSEITGENPKLAFSKSKFSKSKKEMRFLIEKSP